MDVPLRHTVSYSVYILEIPRQKDPIALTCCFRLYYKRLGFLAVELSSEVAVFCGKQPRLRVEAILLWELSAHSVQISS